MVENGAEIAPKDSDGKTPLDLAKSQGSDSYKPVIEYLEQHERQWKLDSLHTLIFEGPNLSIMKMNACV